MNELRYTLITDGSSDTVLIPIITWALRVNGIEGAIQPQWADLRLFSEGAKLDEKIRTSIEYYPCDILFIHRDAEKELRENRAKQIWAAYCTCRMTKIIPIPPICVIPVRMQEAWLLFDETAIRQAAGNKNGRMSLPLPPLNTIESIPDPKNLLHECLRRASGRTGRRLKKFRPASSAHQIPNFIEDFTPLRSLSAFIAFEKDLRGTLKKYIVYEKL